MACNDPCRPNVIFILSDDQGAWALGCAGNREIRTPNLDRLAASGIRFSSMFCASPVCSPARASILTGRIPSQHGIHDWLRDGNVNYEGDRGIEYLKGQTTYTDILAANGYACGFSGKWHMGDSERPQKGFTHWYVHVRGGGPYYGSTMIRDGKIHIEPRYISDAITDDALGFLEARRGSDKPFYLSVHYTAPHSPWDRDSHPKDIYDSYDDCQFEMCPDEPVHKWQINSAPRGTGQARRDILKGYYAAITGMDSGIGRILDKIEGMGLTGNTLVVFTSDNGMNMGHHGLFGKGNATFPPNMYDSSVKVPFILALPGRVPSGAVCENMLSHYDFMPTLLDYLGMENPEAGRLPGRSYAPILRGEAMPESEGVVAYDEYGPTRMIRSREWKYVHRYPYGPNELYNLTDDPDERINRIDDTVRRGIIEEMKGRLDEWFVRYSDPRLDGTKEAVTGKGQSELAGPAGRGKKAFADDWWHIDADGRRRGDNQ
ncbi:MAG TPA: sulfatase-like hydrolase/transferase [Candidatus Brocadiia bacterium]|nr:sulfatase-like hydrolase/transferase [Candidatus Brocadiia bacterium]